MILPRPLHENWEFVTAFIESKFSPGESFTLLDAKRPLIFESIDKVKWVVRCRFRLNIGLMRMYTHVTKDIGLLSPVADLNPEQWLFAGVDGVTNLDRFCKAMALNGAIIPDLTTPRGRDYAAIIDEANAAINGSAVGSSNPDNDLSAVEIIDNRLLIYGTWLDVLAENSGLIVKREDISE